MIKLVRYLTEKNIKSQCRHFVLIVDLKEEHHGEMKGIFIKEDAMPQRKI